MKAVERIARETLDRPPSSRERHWIEGTKLKASLRFIRARRPALGRAVWACVRSIIALELIGNVSRLIESNGELFG
jgi:hypothetical protein